MFKNNIPALVADLGSMDQPQAMRHCLFGKHGSASSYAALFDRYKILCASRCGHNSLIN